MKVLSLSTYPIRARRYGGQRRIAAFADFYRTLGVTMHYVAAYLPSSGGGEPADPDDFAIRAAHPRWDGIPFVGDIAAGEAAAIQPVAYRHFRRLIERIEPDLIQLDHPFMWPLVERGRREGLLAGVPMLYSSHNWEGPLKAQMLRSHLSAREADEIGAEIEEQERAVLDAAVAVVAVSEEEANIYRGLNTQIPVFVVPNGVDRAPSGVARNPALMAPFQQRPYLYFVGSAYPPNSRGFSRLVLSRGLFFHPPEPFIAACGGAVQEIVRSKEYARLAQANAVRMRGFPEVSDADLWTLKSHAHAALLPIEFGGGSNLKTAEALATGKWVVGTPTALRGFEAFRDAPGLVIAETPGEFTEAMAEVLRRPPLELGPEAQAAREGVYWDLCLAGSGLGDFLNRLSSAQPRTP
jgi:glycosyltransferase involved in cell wall biosynthesis